MLILKRTATFIFLSFSVCHISQSNAPWAALSSPNSSPFRTPFLDSPLQCMIESMFLFFSIFFNLFSDRGIDKGLYIYIYILLEHRTCRLQPKKYSKTSQQLSSKNFRCFCSVSVSDTAVSEQSSSSVK